MLSSVRRAFVETKRLDIAAAIRLKPYAQFNRRSIRLIDDGWCRIGWPYRAASRILQNSDGDPWPRLVSMRPLSSTARLLIVSGPGQLG